MESGGERDGSEELSTFVGGIGKLRYEERKEKMRQIWGSMRKFRKNEWLFM
jgi:hypothetical protein